MFQHTRAEIAAAFRTEPAVGIRRPLSQGADLSVAVTLGTEHDMTLAAQEEDRAFVGV